MALLTWVTCLAGAILGLGGALVYSYLNHTLWAPERIRKAKAISACQQINKTSKRIINSLENEERRTSVVVVDKLSEVLGALTRIDRLWNDMENQRDNSQNDLPIRPKPKETPRSNRQVEPVLHDLMTCIVCMVEAKKVLFLPCKHLCVCSRCSLQLRSSCPLCQQRIGSRMEVYV